MMLVWCSLPGLIRRVRPVPDHLNSVMISNDQQLQGWAPQVAAAGGLPEWQCVPQVIARHFKQDPGTHPHQMPHPSGTDWLSTLSVCLSVCVCGVPAGPHPP
jgi:hypothetical protein